MSNKDLLKLENEYRNELPVYKEKPNIKQIEKCHFLTKKVTDFLETTKTESQTNNNQDNKNEKKINSDNKKDNVNSRHVEMDIFIT